MANSGPAATPTEPGLRTAGGRGFDLWRLDIIRKGRWRYSGYGARHVVPFIQQFIERIKLGNALDFENDRHGIFGLNPFGPVVHEVDQHDENENVKNDRP